MNVPKEVTTQRHLPKSDGVYVEGFAEKVRLLFTADTGASMSKRIYDKIPPPHRPSLSKSISLVGASGKPLKEYGKGKFNIKLGELNLLVDAVVADIEDDGMIGSRCFAETAKWTGRHFVEQRRNSFKWS